MGVGTTPVGVRTIATEERTPRIRYAPTGEGDCTNHPVKVAQWKCKEETLTSNPHIWIFL